MSWSFSQEQVAEFWAECFAGTVPFALLSSTPMPDQFYWPDKPTEHSRISRFGMTCGPLTAINGEALLTWFLAASRARTSASQVEVPDWTARGQGYGEKWRGLLGRFDPVSCELKTAQLSLLGDSDESSPTLPRWGLLAVGASLERMTLEQCTSESGSGFWDVGNGKQNEKTYQRIPGLVLSSMWSRDEKTSVSIWSIDGFGPVYEAEILLDGMPERFFCERQTKESSKQVAFSLPSKRLLRALFISKEFAGASQGQRHHEQLKRELADTLRELSQQVALDGAEGKWKVKLNGELFPQPIPALITSEKGSGYWPTPTAMLGASDLNFRCSGDWRKKPNKLGWAVAEAAVKMWPTPTVCGNYNRPGASATSGMGLATAVKTWPTPCASASKGSSPAALTRKDGKDRSNDRLDHAVMNLHNGQLNPEWTEWLMGWPIGHTGLRPLETDRFREFMRQHSNCCLEVRDAGRKAG